MKNYTNTNKNFNRVVSEANSIDLKSPHFEQESWAVLMDMCDALMLQVKQQNKQIIKLNGELKDLKK